MASDQSPTDLLRRTRVEVAPETYFLVSLRKEDWDRVLENPELSPRGSSPYMLMLDRYEVSLLLAEDDWRTMRHAARDAKVEGGFRLLTLDIELGWNVVGFLSLVTAILAEVNVSVGAISAFTRDHLLIKQDDLPVVLRTLGKHVAELC